ncbi:MAG: 4-hydroxy-3-methylbut-2-en-1-yl diphosphate synthase, partial [Calditrichaeota bacterium]
EGFEDIVLSIKSSNTRVMVHTVRLLVAAMEQEGMQFPLHLGVTEAGSGEDGRLKSAAGIGALLADGIGDTIRVSLTEPPENEIPVAAKLVEIFSKRVEHGEIKTVPIKHYNPFEYRKRRSHEVLNIGGEQPAAVVADLRGRIPENLGDEMPEVVICNESELDRLPENWENVTKVVPNQGTIKNSYRVFPLFEIDEKWDECQGPAFVNCSYADFTPGIIAKLESKQDVVLLLESGHQNPTAEMRAFFMAMQNASLTHPVIVSRNYHQSSDENFQLESAADTGLLFLDGYGDGICLSGNVQSVSLLTSTSFGILQATRVRFSKTEYISCPGCGRTLFDLQTTTATVREQTGHLKG